VGLASAEAQGLLQDGFVDAADHRAGGGRAVVALGRAPDEAVELPQDPSNPAGLEQG
jgi:hypothetical protein